MNIFLQKDCNYLILREKQQMINKRKFIFTEFSTTYQDIVILLMLVISAILLILSGLIYKKTSLRE